MVRFKNRYLVVEVQPTNANKKSSKLELKIHSLQLAVLEKLQQLHGDFGIAASKSGFTTKYCNPYTKIAFIRVRHGPHKLVASTLPLVTQVQTTSVIINLLYTGASLLQCNKFLKKYQEHQLRKLLPNIISEEEKQFVKQKYLNIKLAS